MKLNVGERLNLIALIPQQVSMADHRILRELRETLGISEEEYCDYEIVQTEDEASQKTNIRWNVKKPDADIEIGPRATEILVAHFKMLDEKGIVVSEAALELYEKFLPALVEEVTDAD